MTPQARKRLFNVIRILICVAALAFVIRGVTWYDRVPLRDGSPPIVGVVSEISETIRVDLPDGGVREIAHENAVPDATGEPVIAYGLKSTWRNAHKLLLLLAVLIHFPVVLPQAWRFRLLLGAQGIAVGYWECLKLSLAGNFLNFAAPLGSNAGDVFKAYFVSLHTEEHKTEAVATVILDRIIGLGSLLFVVAIITTLSPSGGPLAELRPYMLTMLAIGIVCAVAYLSPVLRRHIVPMSWVRRLPMFEQLRRLDRAAHVLAGRKGLVVVAILLTVFLQALAMAAYCTVALAIGLDVGRHNWAECFAYFYTGTVVQALPGPPQGLGTVELAYRYFFSTLGSPSQIVCMALAIRVVVLICALPGLLVTITGSYRPAEASLIEEGVVLDPERVA